MTPSVPAALLMIGAAKTRRTVKEVTRTDVAHPSLRDQLVSPVLAGNVTVLSLAPVELAGKTVELLRVVLPRSTRFAGLVRRADPLHRDLLAEAESSPHKWSSARPLRPRRPVPFKLAL